MQNYKLGRGQTTELTGRSPLRRRRCALGCSVIEEEGGGEEEEYTCGTAVG
jgi:hypothetical protein